MKALIVYDSLYGNTGEIAKAIAGAIVPSHGANVLRVGELNPSELPTIEFLFIGSPTQGGRPTPAIQDFLNNIPKSSFNSVNAAAFDTRISTRWVGIFGYAAGKIASNMKRKGGTLVASPEGFFVEGKEGPVRAGELERAAGWAKRIIESKE